MFARRRGAPWLPALIAGGLGAALLSKRARWHHGYGSYYGQGSYGKGFAGRGPGRWAERGIPPMIEEMLDAWHKKAHGEAPPATGAAPETEKREI